MPVNKFLMLYKFNVRKTHFKIALFKNNKLGTTIFKTRVETIQWQGVFIFKKLHISLCCTIKHVCCTSQTFDKA